MSDVTLEVSVMVSDAIAYFLDEQFQRLSALEKQVIYWLAIRRNTATEKQLNSDTAPISPEELYNVLASLRGRRCLIEIDDEEEVYVLDRVILKYLTNRFVEENFEEIIQAIQSQHIKGSELFINYAFVTPSSQDKQLQTEQRRRIVIPIRDRLTDLFEGQSKAEAALRELQHLLQEKGSQRYAVQNISRLLEPAA